MPLADNLINDNYLKTPKLIEAFRKIKRVDFLPPEEASFAELNTPLPIGYGQTISQPLTVAFMLELLEPQEGEKILDVGSGSGWTVALLSQIVGAKGKIYGLEIIPKLQRFAETNVAKYGFIQNGIAKILCLDGYGGLPESAPFDKIIVAATAPEIPSALLEQLKIGGRLVLPIGEIGNVQDIVVIEKLGEDKYDRRDYPGFLFVPLVKGS